MTVKNTNLDGILAELTRRKAEKQAGDQGDRDTTHPIKDAPNATQDASTGASASEDSSDVKDQQEIGVENTGGPTTEANPSGSMGVEDKKPEEGADLDNGDTSGTSEMANKDTTHPIAKAAEALKLLDEAIKTAEEAPEKQAAEKLAAYAHELETEHAEAVADGEKFAEYVMGVLATAEKQAAALYEPGLQDLERRTSAFANQPRVADGPSEYIEGQAARVGDPRGGQAQSLLERLRALATLKNLGIGAGVAGAGALGGYGLSRLLGGGAKEDEEEEGKLSLASAQKTAAEKLMNAGAIKQLIKMAATKEDVQKVGGEDGVNKLAMELAEGGVDPAELEAALAAEAGGMDPMAGAVDPAMAGGEGDIDIAQLAAALEEAGITPEVLEAAIAQESLAPEEQDAALDAAMGEAEVSPEEIAAAGGELPMEVVGSADKVKIASDKHAAFLTYKNQLVAELKQLKEGATK